MKKWLFYVGIGDMPPKEAMAHLKSMRKRLKKTKFFPKGRVLFLPVTGTHNCAVEPIEID